jgi:hypothetical protein
MISSTVKRWAGSACTSDDEPEVTFGDACLFSMTGSGERYTCSGAKVAVTDPEPLLTTCEIAA